MEKFLRESCVFFEVCVVRSFRLTFVLLFSLFQVAHCWVAYLKRVLFTFLYNFFLNASKYLWNDFCSVKF